MEGNVIERELIRPRPRATQFTIASSGDDADIRRLLRDHPMEGEISLSFEREPSFFKLASHPIESTQTILARQNGALICVGTCALRERFVNGEPCRVGYLSGLRLSSSHSGQSSILRAGFEFFHQLQLRDPARFYFTSIAQDNHRARRMLERGIPGMPTYTPAGELVTLLLPIRKHQDNSRHHAVPQPPATWDRIAAQLNASNRHGQLAPAWSPSDLPSLSSLGLFPHHFLHYNDASAALWDTSCFKQVVVRGYTSRLRRWRPLLNAWAKFTGGIHLPAIGQSIRAGFVSHLTPGHPAKDLIPLLKKLMCKAADEGLDLLTLALASNDPLLPLVQSRFAFRQYRTVLYWVHWGDCGQVPPARPEGVLRPEVALL